ncbi:LptA/OstA family protein [Hansschlegelia sp. KR7-227]|jgi:lipopolysaccharide export system protein LptA|uniref:LptA/OstA family protein n=1 Tax=Hansschlegelia sp. KR7-227 TaxID=3400914 RepID=UPI003C099CA0
MRLFLAAFAALTMTAGAASAQQSVSSAFTGFSVRSDEPVNVEADNLEVREQENAAVFSGSVVMKQGDSVLKARKLTVFYYGDNDKPKKAPGEARPAQGETKGAEGAASPQAGRDIRRMEAEGDVDVTARNQHATGQRGVFDSQANTAELTGGVVVTQGDSVVRGSRLFVNLATKTSRVEGGGGRVQGVFKPRQRDDAAGAQKR